MGYYDGSQTPAGVDMANGYGLYDMAGNVFEWVWDRYDSSWYADPGATTADTRGPVTSSSGDARMIRGGAWESLYPATLLRCAQRLGVEPDYPYLSWSLGFRCARGG